MDKENPEAESGVHMKRPITCGFHPYSNEGCRCHPMDPLHQLKEVTQDNNGRVVIMSSKPTKIRLTWAL